MVKLTDHTGKLGNHQRTSPLQSRLSGVLFPLADSKIYRLDLGIGDPFLCHVPLFLLFVLPQVQPHGDWWSIILL